MTLNRSTPDILVRRKVKSEMLWGLSRKTLADKNTDFLHWSEEVRESWLIDWLIENPRRPRAKYDSQYTLQYDNLSPKVQTFVCDLANAGTLTEKKMGAHKTFTLSFKRKYL